MVNRFINIVNRFSKYHFVYNRIVVSFNSVEFFIFLFIAFVLYWSRKGMEWQNAIILLSSYVFYAWFSIKFLLLITICAVADYLISLAIYQSKLHKKKYLVLSLLMNLGLLFFFKYYNFFIENTIAVLDHLHIKSNLTLLHIIQPIGISFFTFQTIGYNIDVYKGRFKPTNNLTAFLIFTSFFPQVFAGPIERGYQLVPQLLRKREFDHTLASDGIRQILYGLFKKMVIADRLAIHVNEIFLNYKLYSSSELLIGAIFFYIQIYCDFSGYSDIAIGTAKLFGVNLSTNFKTPFFAKTSQEAWSRWNITLTSWFRDYIYKPLLFKYKENTAWRVFCILFLFAIIGFWHGANYTFIIFGLINGLYLTPNILSKRSKTLKKLFGFLKTNQVFSALSVVFVFTVASITTVFFRSPDVQSALGYLDNFFKFQFAVPSTTILRVFPLITVFFIWEWFQRKHEFQFDVRYFPAFAKLSLYYILAFTILVFGLFIDPTFIYFNF